MARNRIINREIHYFSERLAKKLKRMLSSKTTLIEAPSGYGKTTAVQDFFKKNLPDNAELMWHICLDEPPANAWRRLCRTIQKIDFVIGETLLNIGLPDADLAADIVPLIMDINCETEYFLIIDDFQFIKNTVPSPVWSAFFNHNAAHLHIVVISQILDDAPTGGKSGILYLDSDDLRLRENEAGEYFLQAGVLLSPEKIAEVHRNTDGWMIALYLQLLHYLDTGKFTHVSGIRKLLRETVWNKLNDNERDFLLRISPFDGCTFKQAVYLLNAVDLPQFARKLIENSPFVRYDPANRYYYPHNTLLDFIRGVFEEISESIQKDILFRAGQWCGDNGQIENALNFYYRIRDFESILKLNMVGLELEQSGKINYNEMLTDIASHCTDEMKSKYPMTVLGIAFSLFGLGNYDEFGKICEKTAPLISKSNLPQKEQNELYGLLELFASFSKYNDIRAMSVHHRKAYELMGGTPFIINMTESWTFGNPSVLFSYHAKTGGLDDELAAMDECLPYYFAINKGHGTGANVLMRAEAHFNRGETKQAEVLAHKAWYQSEIKNQTSIYIGAALLLCRLAIYNGNSSEFTSVLERIRLRVEKNALKTDRIEADMAISYIMELLKRPEDVSMWIREGNINEKGLFTQCIPYAHTLLGKFLLLTDKPQVWLGMAEDTAGFADALNCLLGKIYGKICTAAALHKRHDRTGATVAIKEALNIAIPDRLYMPLAENYSWIGSLLAANCAKKDFECIQNMAERHEKGRAKILTEVFENATPFGLTDREYETAKLAVQGLANTEIAKKMFVSMNTVKSHLKSAYQKLDISSRSQLKKKLENNKQ